MLHPPTFKSVNSGLGSNSNPHKEVFADAISQAQPETAPSLRIKALWAHALVLFNVCGIPLSYGTYFEYYHNTLLPTKPPSSLAIPIALQILCILGTPSLIGYIYHALGREREWWRLIFIIAGVVAVAAQVALQWCNQYVLLLILQGPLLGSALGTVWTVSTLVLASHCKSNVPLVSVFCGFTGFVGAVVYTCIAPWGLRSQEGGKKGWAQAISAIIMFGTLLVAYVLMRRVKVDVMKAWTRRYRLKLKLPSNFTRDLRRPSTILFLLGYTAIFFSIFIHPIHGLLILTQPPTLKSPEEATIVWLTTLGVAACTACLSAHFYTHRRIGVVNMFASSAVLAGAAVLAPLRMSQSYISYLLAAVYGVALGGLLPLHIMAAAMFLAPENNKGKSWREDVAARVALIMAIAGMCAFAGMVTAAAVIENMERGIDVALRIAGSGLIGGGMLVAGARFVKWRKLWYAV
ncbi:hypothetical protein T440DRAFT_466120 [Plenodomus tracheiphilus IPT5]|uniref:MFS general substrate transporter n=1 Tax=Plenodomus tracheiphilus IPT5 TaxID=1408161 RepID=A0A6A7BCP5_9PLEO|nr:hypothetical protein T440DRAFT_466120 [Plenodomus tracheiphilus IPT5]